MTSYRIISPDGYVYNRGGWTISEARGQVFPSMTSATLAIIANSLHGSTIEPSTLVPDCHTCGGTGWGVDPGAPAESEDAWCLTCNGTGEEPNGSA